MPAPTGTKRPSAGDALPVRPVAELHRHREPLSVAQKREPHDLSGQQSLADHADEIVGAHDRVVAYRDNHISAIAKVEPVLLALLAAAAKAGLRAWTPRHHARDDGAASDGVPEAARDRRRQMLRVDADVRVRDAPTA